MIISDWNQRPRSGCWAVWALSEAPPAALPHGWTAVHVNTLIDAEAHRLREHLIDLDGALFSGKNPEAWAATKIADRNPYTSDLADSIAVTMALVAAGRTGGDILVMTTDPGLGRGLVAVCRGAGLDAEWRGCSTKLRWRTVVQRLQNGVNIVRDGWQEIRAMHKYRLTPDRVGGAEGWVLSWVRTGSFRGENLQNGDGILGILPRLMGHGGTNVAYIGNPVAWVEGIDAIAGAAASSRHRATLVPAFFSLQARLRATLRALRVSASCKRTLVIDGVDLSPLAKRAVTQESVSDVATRAMLYYEIGRESARRGITPEILLYPYENQPWEKQMIAGFRRFCPGTVLVGFQHTVFSQLYFGADPSRWQLARNYFPDYLIASGPEYQHRLIRCGVAPARIVLGGAFRFPQIAVPPTEPRPPTGLHSVLASLPLQADEAQELASMAVHATARLGLRLVVSFHPSMDMETRTRIRRIAGTIGDVTFTDAAARVLLGDADLLLYNSSGSVFDATAMGVPAVNVVPRARLNLDKLPGGNPLTCRSLDELGAALARLQDPEQVRIHTAILRERMETAFAVPDDALVIDLFGRLKTRATPQNKPDMATL